jgi:hypothetical protein
LEEGGRRLKELELLDSCNHGCLDDGLATVENDVARDYSQVARPNQNKQPTLETNNGDTM